MVKTAVFVSGGGTNLQAILDAEAAGKITDARVALVIGSRPDAYALTRAENAGIETAVVSAKEYPEEEAFAEAVLSLLAEKEIGLIVLAGYMRKIPAAVIRAYPNRILNVHPALIPSFCGKGMDGLRVHEAALARGVKVTGATVHFVNEGLDEGPIIAQKAVAVEEGDTPEILQKRVMKEAEHILLPEVLQMVAHKMSHS